MAEPLFGIETEYAVASFPEKRGVHGEDLARRLVAIARDKLIHLPDITSSCGMFLANSSRLYLDCGSHIEFAGPEVNDPREAVRYAEAGHRIVHELIGSLGPKETRGAEVLGFRANVDYSGSHSTWGCHESHLLRSPLQDLQADLIPFLVTRLVLTGAGGFNPRSPGLEFSLSPRAAYFRHVVTQNSTGERGIWHTKNEPLSSGYGRLHILLGESNCSQTSGVLKMGATALVVAMADAHLSPGASVQLEHPIAALRTVARDVTCTEKLELARGRTLRAIEIQRTYLAQATLHLDDGSLPQWAGEICELWSRTLDNIENGSAGQALDWQIKHALYANRASGMGIRWDTLPAINRAIEDAETVLAEMPSSARDASFEAMLRAMDGLPAEFDEIGAKLESSGLTWSDVLNVFEHRKKLFEADMRFGQLGPDGIFNVLDRSGVLNHRVDGVGDVEAAMTEPPSAGRARLRGDAVRRLSGTSHVHCDWQYVIDHDQALVMDLSDPFVNEGTWQPIDSIELDVPWILQGATINSNSDGGQSSESDPYFLRSEAYHRFVSGDYAGAEEQLRRCVEAGHELASNHCHLARAMTMMDRDAEAREQIELAWAARSEAYSYVEPRLLFFRCLFAILDGADPSEFLGQIKARTNNHAARSSWTMLPVLDHLLPRLGRRNYRFLKALAEFLSETRETGSLERFHEWRTARIPGSAAA